MRVGTSARIHAAFQHFVPIASFLPFSAGSFSSGVLMSGTQGYKFTWMRSRQTPRARVIGDVGGLRVGGLSDYFASAGNVV